METGPQTSPDLSIDRVWGDAWGVYKLLFRRSVLLAVVVYSVVQLPNLVGSFTGHGVTIALLVVSIVLGVAGPILVQGSLVAILRSVHEARKPESIGELLERARGRFWSLLWASIVYGFGVFFGLLALIVPGLLAASRWCLMAPLIMLEGEAAGEARARSRELVRPQTWGVLGIVVATFIAVGAANGIPAGVIGAGHPGPVLTYLISVGVSSLTAPFSAHVLSVLYYRITDPAHPVVHPDVRSWKSVWEGA